MRLLVLSIAFLTACPAHPFEQSAFNPRCLSCTDLVIKSATVQMERLDMVTGKDVPIGTAYKLGILNLIFTPPLLFDVVGPKTSQVGPPTVTSLKWVITLGGEKGIRLEPIVAHMDLETPVTLPLATSVGCRYDMPEQEINLTAIVAPLNALLQKGPVTEKSVNETLQGKVVKLGPLPRSGWLHCEPGVKSAAILAPPQKPVPIAPTGINKPGDSAPPLGQLMTADLALWQLTAGIVTRNGVNTNNPYSPNVINIYVGPDGAIRSTASNGVYKCWTGAAWGC